MIRAPHIDIDDVADLFVEQTGLDPETSPDEFDVFLDEYRCVVEDESIAAAVDSIEFDRLTGERP